MQYRQYGGTAIQLSCVGFGGILVMNESPAEADRLVGLAVDSGVNYFDVAPSYGNAEERLGPALRPYRDQVFLACKTAKRLRDEAAAELRASLERLQCDHFDLYQLHAMTTEEDLEQATGPGGALEAILEARDQGLVRFAGFSAHSVEVALALMDRFRFDSVLFPVNWMEFLNAGFGPQVLRRAEELGMAVLALKAMARQRLPEGASRGEWEKCWYEPCSEEAEALLALRFTLGQGVTSALTPGHEEFFRLALQAADDPQPLSDGELEELRQRAAGLTPFFTLAA